MKMMDNPSNQRIAETLRKMTEELRELEEKFMSRMSMGCATIMEMNENNDNAVKEALKGAGLVFSELAMEDAKQITNLLVHMVTQMSLWSSIPVFSIVSENTTPDQ